MHVPVLLNEVINYLDLKPNDNFIDCTVGQGGHTQIILDKIAPNGKVLGIDWDLKQIENCKENINNNRLILVNDSYANLENIAKQSNFTNINAILLDIGFSSFQTDESKKGFSFLRDEDLDMRYNSEIVDSITAKTIVNNWPESELIRIFQEYGEERFAKKIAKKIIQERQLKKIETTLQLVRIIETAIPSFAKVSQGKHCATRVFQALRIAVNNELNNLQEVLPQAINILNNNGRLAIISFHSLEDRIVKNFFKQKEQEGIVEILTKKPIEASENEIIINPRSRSAKLRVIIKK